MKTWITYLAATALALATTLLMGQSPLFVTIMSSVTVLFEQVGLCILFLLICFGFTSGIASIRKDNNLKKVCGTTIVWAVVSTFALVLLSVAVFTILPSKFPATSTTGNDSSFITSYPLSKFNGFQNLFPTNPLIILSFIQNFLLPLLLVTFVIGYFLKPDVEVIRPAYVVMNSFSELMFRLSRAFTSVSYFFVFFAAGYFFSNIYGEGSIFVAVRFLLMLCLGCLATILIVIPLLFSLFTGFKTNPYQLIYRSIASLAVGLFTGNILLSTVLNEPISRHNLGCQKRIGATTIPFYALIGRGGSAMIATLCTLGLLYSATGNVPESKIMLLIALSCSLMSFCSSIGIGEEVFLICVLSLRALHINVYGSEVSLLGLLPLLNGMGVMIDNLLAGMGSCYTSETLKVRINTSYQDIL